MSHKQNCPMSCTGWGASIPPYCTCGETNIGISGAGGVPREDQLLDEQDEENKRMYDLGFKEGVEAENKAWLSGKRCIDCGEEKDGEFISTCLKCLEEN